MMTPGDVLDIANEFPRNALDECFQLRKVMLVHIALGITDQFPINVFDAERFQLWQR